MVKRLAHLFIIIAFFLIPYHFYFRHFAFAQTVSTNLTLDQLSTQNLGVTHDTTTFYLYGGNEFSQARTNTTTYGFNITNNGNFYTTGLSADLSNSTDLSTLIDQNPNGKHYIFVRFFNQVQFTGVTAYQQPIYGNFSTANNDIWYTKGFGSDIELIQVAQDVNTLSYSTEPDGNTTHSTYYDIVTLVFQVKKCTRYCGNTNRLNFGSLQQFPNIASYNNTTGVTIRYNMVSLNYFDAASNNSIDLSNIETALAQIVQNTSNSVDLSTIQSYLSSLDQKLSNIAQNIPSITPSPNYTYDISQIRYELNGVSNDTASIDSNLNSIYQLLQNTSSQDYSTVLQNVETNVNTMSTGVNTIVQEFTTATPIPTISEDIENNSYNLKFELRNYLNPDTRGFNTDGERQDVGYWFKQLILSLASVLNNYPIQWINTDISICGQHNGPPNELSSYTPLFTLHLPEPWHGTELVSFPIYCTVDYLKAIGAGYGTNYLAPLFVTVTNFILGIMLIVDIYNTVIKIVTPNETDTIEEGHYRF